MYERQQVATIRERMLEQNNPIMHFLTTIQKRYLLS